MNIRSHLTSSEVFNVHRRAVMLVDPSLTQISPLVERLITEGFDVYLADGVETVAAHLRQRAIAYAMTEIRLKDGDGFAVIEAVKHACPLSRIIVHSDFCTLAATVQATKAGASDVLPKPLNLDFLITAILDRSFNVAEFGEFLYDPAVLRAKYIADTYRSCGASTARTARRLSMRRRTLQRIIKREKYV